MTAIINPVNAKYFPEVLPEAIVVTAEASGTHIAGYSAFSPYMMVLNRLYTEQSIDVVTRVDNDSSYATLESENEGRSDREETDIEVPCVSSLDLWAAGASVAANTAYTMRIMKPTIFDKIKYGISLSAEETTLADQFDIKKRFQAGILKQIDTPMFQKIIEVVKKVSVTAGSNTRVGPLINVRSGQKAVLLSIGADETAAPANNDTYITVNRDVNELAYVKLDMAAMPKKDHDIKCYIPGINRLEVIVESVTGITDKIVRYRYAISDITILEKIRWGLPLSTTDTAIATELDLYNAVVAGVM